jgi:hypothetical protein
MIRIAILSGLLLFWPSTASAGPTAKAAQEVAEFLFKKGSKEVAEHGVQAFARKVETAALKHGDDVIRAVKTVGPKALPMIETHGARAAKILGTHGEHGAVWIVSRPRAMNLVAKHGDDAVSALVKHPGVAEELAEKVGHAAIHAFHAIGPQSGRRLAMLAEGETAHLATSPKLLGVIARYGDDAMNFVWRHKGTLAVSAALAAFLADPEPFITGAKDITAVVGENAIKPVAEATAKTATAVVENAVKPLAEAPGKAIESAMPEVAKTTNWTVVIPLGIACLAGLIGFRIWVKRKA